MLTLVKKTNMKHKTYPDNTLLSVQCSCLFPVASLEMFYSWITETLHSLCSGSQQSFSSDSWQLLFYFLLLSVWLVWISHLRSGGIFVLEWHLIQCVFKIHFHCNKWHFYFWISNTHQVYIYIFFIHFSHDGCFYLLL